MRILCDVVHSHEGSSAYIHTDRPGMPGCRGVSPALYSPSRSTTTIGAKLQYAVQCKTLTLFFRSCPTPPLGTPHWAYITRRWRTVYYSELRVTTQTVFGAVVFIVITDEEWAPQECAGTSLCAIACGDEVSDVVVEQVIVDHCSFPGVGERGSHTACSCRCDRPLYLLGTCQVCVIPNCIDVQVCAYL